MKLGRALIGTSAQKIIDSFFESIGPRKCEPKLSRCAAVGLAGLVVPLVQCWRGQCGPAAGNREVFPLPAMAQRRYCISSTQGERKSGGGADACMGDLNVDRHSAFKNAAPRVG